ncbi:hypothetical protein PMZ80_009783 [Knufia obscura]|uniref:Uncharacterized protein n=1 Tax=Knufia obscura TaxID=1635080 RepID=A0ABR0RDB6_9EURO|nr:hypothetical protein PMZ80_009783 [Knufia obscura]
MRSLNHLLTCLACLLFLAADTCAARGTHHPPASVEPDVADSAGNANENANGNGNTDMIASATGFVGVKVESLRATETGIATGNKLSATGKPNSAQDDAAGPEAGPSVPASSALQKTASAIGTMSANIDAPQSDSPAAKRSPDPAPYISTAQLFARKNPVYFDLKCFGSDMEANSRYCGDKSEKEIDGYWCEKNCKCMWTGCIECNVKGLGKGCDQETVEASCREKKTTWNCQCFDQRDGDVQQC